MRSGSKGAGDNDLMISMTKRLTQLEQLNKNLRLEVKEKALKINTLEADNTVLRMSSNEDSLKEITKLKAERDKLKKTTEDMKKFLADYGLKWVGEDGQAHEGKFDKQAINNDLDHKAPNYRNNLPKEIDTEVLSRRIEELNFIAEKQTIITNAYGMKEFKALDPVQIFFFKNGMIIKGFQFYPYYSKQAQSILSDILDGYFPYDLKKKYPEGVQLEPVDCTDDTYSENLTKDVKNPKFKLFQDLQKKDCAPMSKDEFLK